MEVLSCIAVLIVSVFCWYQVKYRKRNKLLSKIPPISPTYPLIGSNLTVLGVPLTEVIEKIVKTTEELGPVWRFDMTPFASGVIVSDPKTIEDVLSNTKLTSKSIEYAFLRNWLGGGLLISNGKKWHQRRKIFTPAFHFKNLEKFVSIMEVHSEIFITKLKAQEGKHINFFPLVGMYTLDVICESAMDRKVNAQTDSNSEYVLAVESASDVWIKRILNPFLRIPWIFRFTSLYEKERKALRTIHGFSREAIKLRREQNGETANNIIGDDLDLGIKKREKVFIDILLNSTIDGKPLSDEDIREEIDMFIAGGHGTTASALAFLFYNLAKHQEIQQKVYEECCAVFGDNFLATVTVSELNQLVYLDKVIKETLRLYPTIPAFSRNMPEDVHLGDFDIPRGTSVYISPYLLARNPKLYPDPMKFDPRRFDAEITATRNPFTFIPFSAGSRNCIGQKFAMLEMKSLVAKVVRNFKISLARGHESLQVTVDLVAHPVDGPILCVKVRK